MGEKRSGRFMSLPRKKRKLRRWITFHLKKELLRKREQAKRDKSVFYVGVGILLLLVVIITIFRLR